MISTGRTGDFQFTGFALSAHRNIHQPYKFKNTHQETHAAGHSVYQDVIFDTKPICTISPETA
jgi:hypothetical protein